MLVLLFICLLNLLNSTDIHIRVMFGLLELLLFSWYMDKDLGKIKMMIFFMKKL